MATVLILSSISRRASFEKEGKRRKRKEKEKKGKPRFARANTFLSTVDHAKTERGGGEKSGIKGKGKKGE